MQTVIKVLNSNSKLVDISYEKQFGNSYEDIQRRVPSIKKIKEFINWEPKIFLEEGIKKLAKSYE